MLCGKILPGRQVFGNGWTDVLAGSLLHLKAKGLVAAGIAAISAFFFTLPDGCQFLPQEKVHQQLVRGAT